MIVWLISDTHSRHRELKVPQADMVIFAGDATNYKNIHHNIEEFEDFLDWFLGLEIPHKVLIGGNHDGCLTKKYMKNRLKSLSLHYLEDSGVEIEGLKIYGSPWTPTFGDWSFMRSRESLGSHWSKIQGPIDILVTHGPPKGVLDLAYRSDGLYEQCGDHGLLRAVERLNPKIHVFGHIHENKAALNAGSAKIQGIDTIFYNASCVVDGIGLPLHYHGHLIEI